MGCRIKRYGAAIFYDLEIVTIDMVVVIKSNVIYNGHAIETGITS